MIAAIRAGQTTYCDPQGLPEVRAAIATKVAADRGLDPIGPERVVVFAGGRPPIGLAQHAYLEPGDEVIYPSPGYPLFESFIQYVGAVPVPLRLGEESGFSFPSAQTRCPGSSPGPSKPRSNVWPIGAAPCVPVPPMWSRST